MEIDVWDLLIDDINMEKMHAHGVSVRRAFEALEEAPVLLPDRAEGGASFLLVGPDRSGEFVTLPIDTTHEYGLWRPRTAYPSKESEVARYRKRRSSK